MNRPDLSRRIERTEEDLTAISDTVLEIKATVDRHTDTLAAHGRELARIREAQRQHGEVLAEHSEVLAGHTEMLAEHGKMLVEHGKMLAEILRRLDAR